MLEPKLRTPDGARAVAFRLLEKVAERMRSEGFHASRLIVAIACYNGPGWSREARFQPCNSTVRPAAAADRPLGSRRGKAARVEVALRDLTPDAEVTKNLFDDGKAAGIDFLMDAINPKFGRGTVSTAAAKDAVRYLEHDRIPFGKPR